MPRSDAVVRILRQTIAVLLGLLVLAIDDRGWTTAAGDAGVGVLRVDGVRVAIVMLVFLHEILLG